MNGRTLFVLFASALTTTLAGCGGDEPAQSSTVRLDGTYRPTESGAIGSITFSNDKDYLLMPTGCASSECADVGTYRFDAERSSLVLENAVTHRVQTVALAEVKTSEPKPLVSKASLGTLDFVDPGEQLTRPGQPTTGNPEQVTGNQQETTNGQQQLAQQVGQLVSTIIQALMNGQGMKRDDNNNDNNDNADKADDKKNDAQTDCKTGVPNAQTPVGEALAYFARCPNGP